MSDSFSVTPPASPLDPSKVGDGGTSGNVGLGTHNQQKTTNISYRNIVTGGDAASLVDMNEDEEEIHADGEWDADIEDMLNGIKVKEVKVGGYDCPQITLSKFEENRIQRPWRRGVIVKLLGRRIGYKALENRLKQMWVKKGIINIIDLGHEYYLVTFTHEDDKNEALLDGPWFIYDHYLTVKEWTPNFHLESEAIVNVAVWIRIANLPIEYYDLKLLHVIGNLAGQTVKVDKNTHQRERGKYARICVEVNISKPLLAIFSIRNRNYKIEYEGLHMLCLRCGKFGHYKEGCSIRDNNGGSMARGDKEKGPTIHMRKENGLVVQKKKLGRKPPELKKKQTPVNNWSGKTGSRFVSLLGDVAKSSGPKKVSADSQAVHLETNDEALIGCNLIGDKKNDMPLLGIAGVGDKGNDEELILSLNRMEVNDDVINVFIENNSATMQREFLTQNYVKDGITEDKREKGPVDKTQNLQGGGQKDEVNNTNIVHLVRPPGKKFVYGECTLEDIQDPEMSAGMDTSMHTMEVLEKKQNSQGIEEEMVDETPEGGAADKDFFRFCKYYTDIYKPEVIVLMETRSEPIKLQTPLKKLGFQQFISVNNNGYEGGILVASKDDNMQLVLINKSDKFIHMQGTDKHGNDWRFTVIYVRPNPSIRKDLWENMRSIAIDMDRPWLVAGGFNDIASANEKKGGGQVSAQKCQIFRDNMEACKLVDLGAHGPKFTWRGPIYHGGQRVYERLDRAICNEEWRLLFEEAQTRVLTRVEFSDHHPIMTSFRSCNHDRAAKPFRFEISWMIENKYIDRLKGHWNNKEDLVSNLKRIEHDATDWKKFSIQHVQRAKKGLMTRLNGIQRNIHLRQNNRGLLKLEKKLQEELKTILRQEELMWFQRSRTKWLVDGDRNTKYYHLQTVKIRRKNKILMLKDESGNWIEDNA
ncbi:uncharacterized protein LOC131635973 [Vicia villosa]|uniref:uncharacterized protein LOC131635973 n=1 Tax=Vicia villosa TaxID=3911 RepID=UPI00273C34FD|nr:uncharacterized protein LOC131635973 [Vicia villosa]